MGKVLSVLSFGFTRSLWEEQGSDDTNRRLGYYADRLEDYVVIANSYKRHKLLPRKFRAGFEAYPTDAYTPLDSVLRMIGIGFRLVRSRRFSLIQAQDPILTGLPALLLGRYSGIPVNVCIYGPNVFDPHWLRAGWTHRLLAPIGRYVLRRVQGIQVDGKKTGRSLRQALGAGPAIHVKPMVPGNFDRFLALTRPRRPGGGPFRLLFAGRLARQKNLPMLAEAFKLACERSGGSPGISLLVAGDGEGKGAFQAVLAGHPAAGRVTFLGTVQHGDMPGIFGEADALVLSSYYEGYPRVLMEAAAAGLPVITTEVSGSDEAVVDGKSGFIVPVGDAHAFADRIAALADDPAMASRMGLAGREHILGELDPAASWERQIAIWNSLTGDGAPGPESRTQVVERRT